MNKNLKISHMMTEGVIYANLDSPFTNVVKFFLKHKINHLPVIDGEQKLVGILSTYDVISAFENALANAGDFTEANVNDKIKVEHIMTKNPATVSPDETVGHVAQIFHVNRFQALPIVENGKLVGIVTTRDLVGWIAKSGF